MTAVGILLLTCPAEGTETINKRLDETRSAGQSVNVDSVIAGLEKNIAGRENEPAEKVFKNIQILKGQPAVRVLRIMQFGFAPALGVECKYCHVEGGWEKDDNQAKQIARKMWNMVGTINQQVKDIVDDKAAVNCYTCHRNQEKPALNPEAKK
jgi:hypothetical protein